MKKINKNNYHLGTIGEFKQLANLHSSDIWKNKSTKKSMKEIALLVEKISGKKVIPSFSSPSGSMYFISENEKELFRVSHHWDFVRSCRWGLNTKNKVNKYKWSLGVIKFCQLKKIDNEK